MEKSYIGWNKIEDFGKEYYSLVQAGFGLSPETRSKRQIELANIIISNSRDYIYKLAHELVFQGGCRMPKATLSLRHERKRISNNGQQIEKEMCIEDLAIAASVGIIEGMDGYDPNKGCLRNFIYYHAIGSMYRGARQKLGLVRLPESAHKRIGKINYCNSSLIEALSEKFGSIYSAQLAHLGITGEYLALYTNTRSSDPWKRRKLEEKVKDPDTIMADDEIANKEILSYAQKALHCLLPIEQKILTMRFGLDGNDGRTLADIGLELGYSRERIRQLESRALDKMHKTLSGQEAL